MITFFLKCGVFGWPILILALVNIVLIVRGIHRLGGDRAQPDAMLENGLNAILFWGGIAAVIGLLGQVTALYLSIRIIQRAGIISPAHVAEGLAVSFSTNIWGLTLFIVAALLWFILSSWCRSLTRQVT